MASDLLNGTALPSTDESNAFDEHRAKVREAYATTLDAMLERTVDEFVLPAQQEAALLDALQFTLFVGSIKLAKVRGAQGDDRKAVHQAFRHITKSTDEEVPTMLNHFIDAVKAGEA